MNWKEEAAEKLRRYETMRAAVANIPEELQRLRLDAVSIRAARTDTPSVRGSGGKREEALMNNLIRREELKRVYQGARLWVNATQRALDALTPEEKLILHSLYICPGRGTVEQLCERLQVEKSSVYRKRDRALERFTLAYYGQLES